MTNAHDTERMAAYHVVIVPPDTPEPTEGHIMKWSDTRQPTDTERRLAVLEADNAALKAAVARLEAIVNAIREYGEL